MSSFLSSTIDSIFCKYDISPSIKRFLSECIIQLINVSLLSIEQIPKNNHNKTTQTLINHNFSKQYETISEWLENFIEPQHLSMYTSTIIHIIRSLQNHIIGGQHHHHSNHSAQHSKHKSYHSLSINLNSAHSSMSITDLAMSPIEEQPPSNKSSSKLQRLSIFANLTNNNHHNVDGNDIYDRRLSATNSRNSQLSDRGDLIRRNHSLDPNDLNNDDAILHNLNWTKYQKMSIILIGSLTNIIKKVLKRNDNKMDIIFDKSFDVIIDDVVQFLFSRLTFGVIIGECLGVFSKKYLQKICEKIHSQWSVLIDSKKRKTMNDIKKIAILHRAVKYLEFDIYGKNRNAAIDYLTHLCIRMQRTEKTLLRQQICHSLLHIFDSISPKKQSDEETQFDDDEMINNKPLIRLCPNKTDKEFWTIYYNIFNIVEQWARHKKSCTIFCYELIIKMMCCGNLPFYLHALKYQPASKSGYSLPSLHRNTINKMMASHHKQQKKMNENVSSPLPESPSKSPIIKFLISNLTKDANTKRDTLKIILQFIQELPEEFVLADNEWYASFLGYLEYKIILSSNPNCSSEELNLIASIFTAFAERDGKSYFVPVTQRLLVDNNAWWNKIGLTTLLHAVRRFGHSLSKWNFTLGACLSPLVKSFVYFFVFFVLLLLVP